MHALGNCSAYPGHFVTMQKYGHIGTFWIEKYGPHIAILVFSALARLNLVVSSTIPASCASVSD